MNKKDDITYLGVDNTPETSQEPLKRKSEKTERTRFKTNKHSFKLNSLIASSKGFKIPKKAIIIILIIVAISAIRPIKFIQDTLDRKRAYYAMVNEYKQSISGLDINLDVDFENLWDKFVFATGEEYYKNCRGTMLMPVDGSITCHYDFAHMGIDIQANTYPGTVYAAANGTVCYVGTSSKYGRDLMIQHNINGMTIYTYYANLNNIFVSVGQEVTNSTPIATEAGTSENTAVSVDGTDHHVHFAVRKTPKESSGLNPVVFAKYR